MKRNATFWNAVAALAGFAAVAAAVITFLIARSDSQSRQQREDERQRRALSVRSSLPTVIQVPNDRPTGKELSISYADRVIDKYVILRLEVLNLGAQPIKSTEYEVPLRLHLQDFEELVSAAIVASSPSDLGVTASVGSNYVELSSVLLNPDDRYTVELGLVARSTQDPSVKMVTGRIVGVKQIDYNSPLTRTEVREAIARANELFLEVADLRAPRERSFFYSSKFYIILAFVLGITSGAFAILYLVPVLGTLSS